MFASRPTQAAPPPDAPADMQPRNCSTKTEDVIASLVELNSAEARDPRMVLVVLDALDAKTALDGFAVAAIAGKGGVRAIGRAMILNQQDDAIQDIGGELLLRASAGFKVFPVRKKTGDPL